MDLKLATMTGWQRDFVLVVFPAVAVLACAFAPGLFNDGDTNWHLAAGRWILENRAVPHTDPFSYTMQGQPWTAHEWLSEAILAVVYQVAGWSGTALLSAAAAAATMAMIALRVRTRLSTMATVLTLVLTFFLIAPSLLVRPHILALPILTGWVIALLAAREKDRAPPLWLAGLMVVWANMHGGYVLGLALAAVFALEALIQSPGRRLEVVRTWGLFGLLSGLAAMITPHGWQGFLFPFQVMTMDTLSSISEWKSADFSKPSGLEAGILAVLFFCLWRGVQVSAFRLIVLLMLLHMALQHARHGFVLGVVAPLLLLEPLAKAYPPLPSGEEPEDTSAMKWGFRAATLVLVVSVIAVRLAIPIQPRDRQTVPVTALAAVPAELRTQPVFNSYSFGGWLIFNGVRPFIDGRADMYGDAHMKKFLAIEGGDQAAFDRGVSEYGFAWTILTPKNRLVRQLDASPDWVRIHTDEHAVVHMRRDPGQQVRPPAQRTTS